MIKTIHEQVDALCEERLKVLELITRAAEGDRSSISEASVMPRFSIVAYEALRIAEERGEEKSKKRIAELEEEVETLMKNFGTPGYDCKNKTPEEILFALGFEHGESRGYVLERTGRKANSSCVQVHALITGNTIELHKDYSDGKGGHVSSKDKNKLFRFYELIEDVDMGREVVLGGSIKRKYRGLREAVNK